MIKLYQFAPAFGLPNASPFCMKVENYLRMTGMPYEVPRNARVLKAPKGKLPYIEDNGKLIADSAFIIEYIKATYGNKLDSGLTAEQTAIVLAFQHLLEENSYFGRNRLRFYRQPPLGSGGLSAKTARASIFATGSLLPAHEGALLFLTPQPSSCVEMARGLRRSLCV